MDQRVKGWPSLVWRVVSVATTKSSSSGLSGRDGRWAADGIIRSSVVTRYQQGLAPPDRLANLAAQCWSVVHAGPCPLTDAERSSGLRRLRPGKPTVVELRGVSRLARCGRA
jgi:hypothetical protein